MNVEDKLHCTHERAAEIMKHPETQLFLYILLIMKLIDDGDLNNVSSLSICTKRWLIFHRLKNSAILLCWDAEEWTKERWIISSQKQSTSLQLLTRRRIFSSNSDPQCLRLIKIALCTRIRLARQLRWTSSLGPTFSRIYMSRHAILSPNLDSRMVSQTISTLDISIMLAGSRPSNLSILRHKLVSSRVRGRDLKLEHLASESKSKSCWLLWNSWWERFRLVWYLTNLTSRNLSIHIS